MSVSLSDAAAVGTEDGYVNLRHLQPGVAQERDQSTYSDWLAIHQRRRRQEPN